MVKWLILVRFDFASRSCVCEGTWSDSGGRRCRGKLRWTPYSKGAYSQVVETRQVLGNHDWKEAMVSALQRREGPLQKRGATLTPSRRRWSSENEDWEKGTGLANTKITGHVWELWQKQRLWCGWQRWECEDTKWMQRMGSNCIFRCKMNKQQTDKI